MPRGPLPAPRLDAVTPLRLAVVAALLCLGMTVPALAAGDLSGATAGAAAAAAPAPTAESAACPGSIRLGGRAYAYYQQGVNCGRARRAVRRLYATRGREGAPRGFRCRSRSNFRRHGGCTTRNRKRYFGFSS